MEKYFNELPPLQVTRIRVILETPESYEMDTFTLDFQSNEFAKKAFTHLFEEVKFDGRFFVRSKVMENYEALCKEYPDEVIAAQDNPRYVEDIEGD